MGRPGTRAAVILGAGAPALVAEIERHGVFARTTDLDNLARDIVGAPVLLLDDASPEEAIPIIPSIREAMPSLVILAVRTAGFPQGWQRIADQADEAYVWPDQTAELLEAVRAATSTSRKRLAPYPAVTAWGPLAAAALGLAVWWSLSALAVIPAYIVPTPAAVLDAFADDANGFLVNASVTAAEAAAGFLVGNLLGAATAVALYRWAGARSVSLPVLTGLQALPIVALAPFLTIAFGTGMLAKVLMAAIVCYFPVVANLMEGFGAADRDLRQLFLFHRATYADTLRRLLIPSSLPAFAAALRISGGLAVVGAVVAEFTGADRGLGYLLLIESYRFQSARLMVAVILCGLLGVAFVNIPRMLLSVLADRSALPEPSATTSL